MTTWEMHDKIAETDGIDRKIMRRVNKLIDTFHRDKTSGINPEHVEWACCTIVINTLINMQNEKERAKSIKAAIHHYALDFIEKNKQFNLLKIAENEGLKGVRDYLKTNNNLLNFIERWYLIHEEKDTQRLLDKAQNLAQDFESYFTSGTTTQLMQPLKKEDYYECLKCGYVCPPHRAEELKYTCPKCKDSLWRELE